MNIIFLGAPGSGKGTQASLVASNFQIPSISTGEILRKEVDTGTEVGNLAKSYMESGGLVPDEVVVEIIRNRISQIDCTKGFILDGFPRNNSQAEILDKMLFGLGKRVDLVINIEVDNIVLIKRICGRFSCAKCSAVYNKFFCPTKIENICDKCGGVDFISRVDDNEETVKNRLIVYDKNTKELIEFYRKKGLIYSVDGLKDIALVNVEINKALIQISNN